MTTFLELVSMKRAELSFDQVSAVLSADLNDGKLYWLERPREMFATLRAANVWNRRYAGKEALTCLSFQGYLTGRIYYKKYPAHRVLWLLYTGRWPDDQIDHINGNRSDNRICNLRPVNNRENSKNKSLQSNNSSGVTGVRWNRKAQKWLAQIGLNGENKYLGLFDEFDAAVFCRKAAEIENGFHPNHGRAFE